MNPVKWFSGSLPLNANAETRWVFLHDVHFPHHLRMDHLHKFLRDFKPHYLILGGDIDNGDPVNHWQESNKKKAREMPLIKEHFARMNKEWIHPLLKNLPDSCSVVYQIGNHEVWYYNAIEANPNGHGYWEPENNLDGIDMWVEAGLYVNLGRVNFMHGHNEAAGIHHAHKVVMTHAHSVRYGHCHDVQFASRTSPIYFKERHTARSGGCWCIIDPPFMRHRPHRWQPAFTYGRTLPNGRFHDECALSIDGNFMAEGRLYGPDNMPRRAA